MSPAPRDDVPQRSDVQRNRERIVDAARAVFADDPEEGTPMSSGVPERSMAEVARRAGVGRATVYRHFPERRDLLEALFADEVDAVIAAAVPSQDHPGDALIGWLHRFATFEGSKHAIVSELLEYTSATDPVFGSSRHRVMAAGKPLLDAAQLAGVIRQDVALGEVLDLVFAVVRLDRPPAQLQLILNIALDGLRPAAQPAHPA